MLHRNQGFLCADCPKLFFNKTPAPRPVPSPAPGGGRKRSTRGPLTSNLFEMITRERHIEPRRSTPRDGVKIRGRWTASCVYPFYPAPLNLLKCYPLAAAKRQTAGGIGSAFDGSSGVDSQDILAIPSIGFGSFQLFPDQNSYSTVSTQLTPPSADFNGTVRQGTAWIQAQAASALA